jgi:hypothetical protein
MKIINKSGNEECRSEDSFYVLLVKDTDYWEGPDFHFEDGGKYDTEEAAIRDADPGDAVAKVTLVAKIV